MSTSADISALMAHAGWVRNLARQLVNDPNEADELVQETWLSALRRPPREDRPLRGWLATVMRRAHGHRLTQASSRSKRERRAAQKEAQPSTAEVLANAELHRKLVETVLALEEPYRTTLLMRFFEDRPPREIARTMAIPVATVQSRLRRGLARLRERLDEDFGSRAAWHGAMTLFVGLPRTDGAGLELFKQATTLQGVTVMKSGLKLAAIGSILGAAVLWIVWSPITPVPTDASTEHAAPKVVADLRDQTPSIEVMSPLRTAVASKAATSSNPTGEPERSVRGLVIDAYGRGVPGVQVRTEGCAVISRTTAGANGEFAVPVHQGCTSIVSDDPSFSTVLAGSAQVEGATRSILVVAAPIRLNGAVVDAESNLPLEGAVVRVRLAKSFGAGLGQLLDHSRQQSWEAVSASDGSFAVAAIPDVAESQLHVSREGFEASSSRVLSGPTSDRLVRLQPLRTSGMAIRGMVLDRYGRTVENAFVSVGTKTTQSDSFGRFDLDWPETLDRVRLIGLHRGYTPGIQELSREDHLEADANIELRLGDAPLNLLGRVMGVDGQPIADARVWLADPTYFGPFRGTPQQVESLLGSEAPELWTFVATDAGGRFEMKGLQDREYGLSVLDPETHSLHTFEGVPAGADDLELVLPRDDSVLFERIAGRVVTRPGIPVSGARVRLQRIAFEVIMPDGGTWDQPLVRETIRTDERGDFEFHNVPRTGMELGVEGDDILPASVFVESLKDVSRFTVTVERRCHLQVRLTRSASADALEVLDARGRRLLLRVIRGGPSRTGRRHPIHGLESHILSVSGSGAQVVFFKGGTETHRMPIRLEPGVVNVVSW